MARNAHRPGPMVVYTTIPITIRMASTSPASILKNQLRNRHLASILAHLASILATVHMLYKVGMGSTLGKAESDSQLTFIIHTHKVAIKLKNINSEWSSHTLYPPIPSTLIAFSASLQSCCFSSSLPANFFSSLRYFRQYIRTVLP